MKTEMEKRERESRDSYAQATIQHAEQLTDLGKKKLAQSKNTVCLFLPEIMEKSMFIVCLSIIHRGILQPEADC